MCYYCIWCYCCLQVMQLDLRKQGVVQVYKGVGGSVRQISMHPQLDTFAVASLDRWLAVFDVSSHSAPTHRLYLKQQQTAVLLSKDTTKQEPKKSRTVSDAEKVDFPTPKKLKTKKSAKIARGDQ
eukprot:c6800_g1_i1.p1 GENE.c6800_g1_i1~~c6800_g1_i1.p1  ORF type:complete len:125 (+),score=26.81 c6800_g1_i1:31-405(+)